jgi:phenylalanyl-tRNA synthetase beta chain
MVYPTTARSYEHPQRAALVGSVGRLFEFHPNMVENGRAAVLDLNLALLNQPHEVKYQPLRRFPESAFDLSVIVPERTLIADVQNAIPKVPEILSIEFLREFAMNDSKRSLTYRITLGADDRTLTSEEAGAVRAQIIAAIERGGYEFRSTL